jgi:hypothetical protein
MEFPPKCPSHLCASVEAEKIRATRDFKKVREGHARSTSGRHEELEAELTKLILRVYVVFVKGASKSGLGDATAVRSHARQFLRDLTSEVYAAEGYDDGTVYPGQICRLPEMTSHLDGTILPYVMQRFTKSPQWTEAEDAMLQLAEAQAAPVRPQQSLNPLRCVPEESGGTNPGTPDPVGDLLEHPRMTLEANCDGIGAGTVAAERSALLSDFKMKGRKLGIKITDTMVAKAANPKWNDRMQVAP